MFRKLPESGAPALTLTIDGEPVAASPVSYTHLTLPTNREV